MKKLKFGIIGCGGIANQKHLPALAKLADQVELVAFCDTIIERAEAAAAEYGVADALVTEDYKEVVKQADIDVHYKKNEDIVQKCLIFKRTI